MFGYEQNKENKPNSLAYYGFELEDKIEKDEGYTKVLAKQIDDRILQIKDFLRRGATKEDFDNLAIVLNAYIAFQKVIKRVEAQKLLRKRRT
ncbi:MAG: hypothetical protein K940chlam8_00153 [Chlamydiae bacterium]|nr:hypothetical protein [Chlamydiota bacterium]